ncbi:hypothetical protein C0Q70_17880 [Pomacea canaliculata]|uniref:Homeobox domain-containing protein n=1 Tax=Pomacea canaliculata TaxID=400727 RepID=A0A2T7NLM6_POMCA|nr:hypothetical protein C0Q70_17880 [Pomacea canaliculata]
MKRTPQSRKATHGIKLTLLATTAGLSTNPYEAGFLFLVFSPPPPHLPTTTTTTTTTSTQIMKKFSKRCARCDRIICPKMDWIRKATTMYYHLACFLCAVCGRQLSTGECFKLIDGSILCEKHCVDPDLQKEEINQKAKTKRVRTTFTEEQIRILMDHFVHDCNPDGADLEMIAKRTGLTKRVTQVWFQNSRARQKKHQQQHPGDKKNNNTTTANNNNSFNPSGLLSGIPSVGSDHSSELPAEMHSEDWSPVEDDDRLSGVALNEYERKFQNGQQKKVMNFDSCKIPEDTLD